MQMALTLDDQLRTQVKQQHKIIGLKKTTREILKFQQFKTIIKASPQLFQNSMFYISFIQINYLPTITAL